MTYKTILVHCDVSAKLLPRLEVAVDLAQRFGAHLVGVHVQVPIDIPAFSAGMMPPFDAYGAYEAAASAEHDATADTFEQASKGSRVLTDWRLVKGVHEEELVVQSRYADLLILGQTEPESETLTPGTPPKPWLYRPLARCWSSRISVYAASPANQSYCAGTTAVNVRAQRLKPSRSLSRRQRSSF